MHNRATRLAPALLALALAGCALGPAYQRPALELPGSFAAAPAAATLSDHVGDAWWHHYRDPALDALVDEALAHNADVRIAAARVAEARALAGIADADRFPSVDARAGSSRARSSRETMPTEPRTRNVHSLELGASYELDLWGRYRRASEAARAELLASEAAARTVALSLAADVAARYFALIAGDERLRILAEALASRRDSAELLRRRVEAGTGAQIEVLQAEAEARGIEAELAAAQAAQERTEATLAVLLGRSPREVFDGVAARGAAAEAPVVVPAGLPAELLARRPDLVQAEQALIAANARIGEARALRLPAISLTAALGSESTEFSRLLDAGTGTFSLALGLTQPIWNAGRLARNEQATEARAEQARAAYVQAVAQAFADVRGALAEQRGALERRSAQAGRVQTLAEALGQAQLRFDAGIVSRLEVLDTERNLLDAQLALADAAAAQRTAVADLFRALGGGWPTSSP